MVNLKDKVLKSVEKPARYIGKEINCIYKNKEEVDIRFAFCFPDVYDVGMSHLGMKILYHNLNSRKDTYCERVFAPWIDMENVMRKNNIPLYALESRDAIGEFDFVAFTLQYELCYTNILNMLDLGNIPLTSKERMERAENGDNMPFVLVGGPCAYNCEPIADFIDIVSLGEGEYNLNQILDKYKEWQGSGKTRLEFLESLVDVPGVYIPQFYDVAYKENGTIKSITPKKEKYPKKVSKVVIEDMTSVDYPTKFIVPYVKPIHDRAMIELFRGCLRGCRFCQAGMIYRPVRERSAERLLQLAEDIIDSTGFEELALTSLSTSDYKDIEELIQGLAKLVEKKKIKLSVPSLRLDSVSKSLIQAIQGTRTSSFTFAPEAGTQRMRNVINKNITEEDLTNAVKNAFEEGCNNIKLYFMIGLPTETEQDLEGILKLGYDVLDQYFAIPKEKRNKGINVTISTSNFVPKPFTPFQWEPQDTVEQFKEKQEKLKMYVRTKKISLRWHDAKLSRLEGVMAKGDRRLGQVIFKAWQNGCIFDSWDDKFNYDGWMKAFEEVGLDPAFYANRRLDLDEILPWDHIDVGVTKDFLKKEYKKAVEAKTTEQCRIECQHCGAAKYKGGVCFE